jgi:hypothetical protein
MRVGVRVGLHRTQCTIPTSSLSLPLPPPPLPIKLPSVSFQDFCSVCLYLVDDATANPDANHEADLSSGDRVAVLQERRKKLGLNKPRVRSRTPAKTAGTIYRLYSYCTPTVLLLYSYCTHTVLILYSYCTHCTLQAGVQQRAKAGQGRV